MTNSDSDFAKPFKAKHTFKKSYYFEQMCGYCFMRLGTGNLYRTTGITFGQGKSTVIKICKDFMEKLICHKNVFIKFSEDPRDVVQTIRKMEDNAGFPNAVRAIDGSHI